MPVVSFDDIETPKKETLPLRKLGPFPGLPTTQAVAKKPALFPRFGFIGKDFTPAKAKTVTFDDVTQKPLFGVGGAFKTEPTEPVGGDFSTALEKAETIGQAPSWQQRIKGSIKTKGALIPKALIGDIPFVRKLLPESVQRLKPRTTVERAGYGLTRLGRDIGIIAATEGAGVGVVSKMKALPALAKTAGTYPNIIKALGQFGRGATLGAVTAGTEEPTEIAKEAGKLGAIFLAFPLLLKSGSDVARGMWRKLPQQGRDWLKARGQQVALHIPKTKAYNLLQERESRIAVSEIDSFAFRRQLTENLTKQERELIPFLREKETLWVSDSFKKMNRPDLQEAWKASSAVPEEWTGKVVDYLDDAHKFLMENSADDVDFVRGFASKLFNIPAGQEKAVASHFAKRSPQLKDKFASILDEGVNKLGLTPKTLDVADIIGIYDKAKINTVANLNFSRGLANLKDLTGTSLIQPISTAPKGWIPINHPSLRQAMKHVSGADEAKKMALDRATLMAHPEVADVVKATLGKPFEYGKTITTMNAVAKKLNLSLSLFHHTALTETGIATMGLKKPLQMLNPVRMLKALKSGNYGVFKDLPLTKDAVAHGLQVGASPDVQKHIVYNALSNAEKTLRNRLPGMLGKGGAGVVKGIRKANEWWDKGLWDYYHNSLKLYGYESLTAKMLKRHPNLKSEAVKREVAQFVNDTFGGQSWELMVKSPQWRQGMQWLMLAPDWTISTIRQGLSPFGGAGAVSEATRAVRKELGQEFWERAFPYFYGGMNLLNKAMTEVDTGKGRFMWENTPGHKTHLYLDQHPGEPEQYLRWGKQFREIPEWLINFPKKFGGKLSPALRQAITQLSGYTATGWRTPIADEPFISAEGLKARAGELGKAALPYSMAQIGRSGFSALRLAMPISKGMTPYKAREYFRQGIERQDKKFLTEIFTSALQNNLNAEKLFKQARSSIKSDITYSYKREAYKIADKLRRLGKAEGKFELQRMRNAEELSPALEKQLLKILKAEEKVKVLKETFKGAVPEKLLKSIEGLGK